MSMHHFSELSPPSWSNHEIQQALQGLKQGSKELPCRRLPITRSHLEDIHDRLHRVPRYLRRCFWAACVTSCGVQQTSSSLPQRNRTTISVATLETSQFANDRHQVQLPVLQGKVTLYPTIALRHLLSDLKRCSSSTPVLSYYYKHQWRPLTPQLFTKWVRKTLRSSGSDVSRISVHFFRLGGATYAASTGVSTASLKRQGNRRSDCYLCYVDENVARCTNFAPTLGRGDPCADPS
ncbi:hypothetical protein RvY_10945-2 [Ramazzottius varieornatus]|uniref:Tyr recombinase domain-containing protein n=1 Tax=Ramazzottius varieornatus TaxID=947166 RepID=A0A1D1VGI2_RAMVA|nr:hypothetical protein RvY_10945-2 [Ramazzottius varieornatus]